MDDNNNKIIDPECNFSFDVAFFYNLSCCLFAVVIRFLILNLFNRSDTSQ